MNRIVVAVIVVAVAAVTAVLLIGHTTPVRGVKPVHELTVRTSFDPPAVEFGDRVVARVDVLADSGVLDTSRLKLVQNLAPLTVLGPTKVSRTTRGRLVVISYSQPAVCLAEACLAGKGPKNMYLHAARIEAPRQDGSIALAVAPWPRLPVNSRVTPADLAPSVPRFRADTSIPAVSYRIDPGTLATVLDVIAVLLVATGIGLAVWQATVLVRRKRDTDTRTTLERAVALVREAESRPPEDRRRAVGLLARVLRRRDETLAGAAGDLAWSEPAPTPDELAALADRVGKGNST